MNNWKTIEKEFDKAKIITMSTNDGSPTDGIVFVERDKMLSFFKKHCVPIDDMLKPSLPRPCEKHKVTPCNDCAATVAEEIGKMLTTPHCVPREEAEDKVIDAKLENLLSLTTQDVLEMIGEDRKVPYKKGTGINQHMVGQSVEDLGYNQAKAEMREKLA